MDNFFGLFGNSHNTDVDNDVDTDANIDKTESNHKPENYEQLMNHFVNDKIQKENRKNEKNCSICHLNQYKYKCPCCLRKTCSIKCLKKHKQIWKCSGIRNETSFIPLKHYTKINFDSDYKFLEKGIETLRDSNRILTNNPQYQSTWTARFIQECQQRHIKYEKMPIIFQRSKSNRSIYLYKDKQIYWDVEFQFQINNNNFKAIKRDRINEKFLLNDVIQQIIDDDNQEIKQFYSNNNKQYFIYFKQNKNNRIILEPKWTLEKNFENKTIIEYPTLIISQHLLI